MREQPTEHFEPIYCPNCDGSDRLQFLPMLGGTVYAQCPCGYGWELPKEPELIN